LWGEELTAAHIVPFAIGETNCNYLFLDDDVSPTGHLMHPGNGLLLHHLLEKAMDKARIAIVPADETNPSARDLKVVVFDRDIFNIKSGLSFPWSELDGRRLEFKNDNRPRLRYLYFTFLMSMFRRRRFECTGWKSDLTRYLGGKMWASPGNWIRGSSIRAIARRIAHETNLEAFADTHDLPLQPKTTDKRDDDVVADEVMECYEAKVLNEETDYEETDSRTRN
jgi:HNH endonuclease